jgi:hypothetical protein
MLLTSALRSAFRAAFGPLPESVPEEAATGLVLAADGIGGLDLSATGLHYEVARAGFGYRVETVGWCHGFGHWYRDLTRRENVRRHAAQVARRVLDFRASRTSAPGPLDDANAGSAAAAPDPAARPVFLVGKSGGTGVLIEALEQLPDDSVERAILIAPALSSRYDLRRALRAVRRDLVVYWSPLDVVLLGAGTKLFGTIDRVRSVGAGLTGFREPREFDDAGRALYAAKLRQVRWAWRMARTGYLGGHVGPDSPWFLRRFVIPLLTPGESQAGGGAGR